MAENTAKQIQVKDFVQTSVTVISTGVELETEAFCFDAHKETQIHYSVTLPEHGDRHGQKYSVTLARKEGRLVKVLGSVKLTKGNVEALGLDVEPDSGRSANILVEVAEISHDDFTEPMPSATQEELSGLTLDTPEGEEGATVEWLDTVERLWGLDRARCVEQLAELGYEARKVFARVHDEIENVETRGWLVVVNNFCEGFDNACRGTHYHEVMDACQGVK